MMISKKDLIDFIKRNPENMSDLADADTVETGDWNNSYIRMLWNQLKEKYERLAFFEDSF